MIDFKNRKNIIFDYDGTLHNSIKIYAPAFRTAYEYLVKNEYAEEKHFTDDEISIWLGYSSKDMWNNFMPSLPDEEKLKCSGIIGANMLKYIGENKAELYKGSLDVLKALKERGFNLIFLSNCKIEYMNKHIEFFSLDNYFKDFYCTEQFGFIPKYEIFEYIKEKHPGKFIILGDRYMDIEIALIHKEFSIGCEYGFGTKEELKNADIIINDIRNILNYLD